MTSTEIINRIAAVKAEMNRTRVQLDEKANIFDPFCHLVEHDSQENNLAHVLDLGLTILGKKPTKKTSKAKLEVALEAYKKDALGITAMEKQFFTLSGELQDLEDMLQTPEEAQADAAYEENENEPEEQENRSMDEGDVTVTLPLTAEDKMASGTMESDLNESIEVQKVEIPAVPQEDPATRAKRRIKESAILRQALALAKDISMDERGIISAHIRAHNWNSNLATLSDEEAQRWIDFIQHMRYQNALARETAVRERIMSQAIAAYNKPEKPGIPATIKKTGTAKKIDGKVHVTSEDKIVSFRESKPVSPVPTPININAKKTVADKPVKEVKQPVEKAIPADSLITKEQEQDCYIWEAGEYPGMSIPAGFRVRKEKSTGLYRVDHWNGSSWETYINKAGKVGFTKHASELKQWFDKWQMQLGIAA